jgi:hypothetical protein
MLAYLIKDFARSLTKIDDERYRKCYMVKAKLQKFKTIKEEILDSLEFWITIYIEM